MSPYLKPTFNFAAYANKSTTLQELVKLGVNLHKIEKNVKVVPLILGLDFERDVKKHIIFLNDLGVEDIGGFLTKNPFILQEDLNDLAVRINYLKYKKFQAPMIHRIVSKNPLWLTLTTQKIDSRLGFFQKEFYLKGDEVRSLATQLPKLITYKLQKVKLNKFALAEEMGFNSEELKCILLGKPCLFIKGI